MEAVWTVVTIIGSTAVATGTILTIYSSHKRSIENRIKELETKVENHGKFVNILENRALKAIEEEFDNLGKSPNKRLNG